MPNPSYQKGYRFENAVKKVLETLGVCRRSHQSGAYTGEPDLRWSFNAGRFLTVSCKIREKPLSKVIDEELKTHDIIVHRSDNTEAKVTITLALFTELLGTVKPIGA